MLHEVDLSYKVMCMQTKLMAADALAPKPWMAVYKRGDCMVSRETEHFEICADIQDRADLHAGLQGDAAREGDIVLRDSRPGQAVPQPVRCNVQHGDLSPPATAGLLTILCLGKMVASQ